MRNNTTSVSVKVIHLISDTVRKTTCHSFSFPYLALTLIDFKLFLNF